MLKRPTSSNTISPLWDKLKSKPAPYLLAPKCPIINPTYRTFWNRNADTNADNLCCRKTRTLASTVMLLFVLRGRDSDLLRSPRSGVRTTVGGEIFRICQDRPQDPSSLCTTSTGSHSRGHPIISVWNLRTLYSREVTQCQGTKTTHSTQ